MFNWWDHTGPDQILFVGCSLSSEIAADVCDVPITPPTMDAYGTLKTMLIFLHRDLGKRHFPALSSAVRANATGRQFFCVGDKTTGLRLLIDTGAEVRIVRDMDFPSAICTFMTYFSQAEQPTSPHSILEHCLDAWRGTGCNQS